MQNQIQINSSVATMSSLEIAQLTGKRHSDVIRDIKSILEQAEIDERSFASVYKAGNGEMRPCFNLPRRECDLVIAGYSVKYRLAIIDRWQELEIQQQAIDPMKALTDPATMRQLLLGYTEQVIELQGKVEEMQPVVQAYDRIATATEGAVNITSAAKALQIQPGKLFTRLNQAGWIYKRPGSKNWLGYQAKIKQGLLEHKTAVVDHGYGYDTMSVQVLLTPKGLAALSTLLQVGGAK